MNNFFKDWRNIALATCGILIVALCITMLMVQANNAGAVSVVSVGDRTFTEKEIVDTLKARVGDQVLMGMIGNALLKNYARQQNVEVSPAEIDSALKSIQAKSEILQMPVEESLNAYGISSLATARDELYMRLLAMKLVIEPKSLEAAVTKAAKSGNIPYTIPAHYKFRQFIFASKAIAEKGHALLLKSGGMQEAARMTINEKDTETVYPLFPSLLKPDMTMMNMLAKTLSGMKPGDISAPLDIKQGELRLVVMFVGAVPLEQPTMANRGMLIGLDLMNTTEFRQKSVELEAKALANVDVRFYNDDYKTVHDAIVQHKKENPDVPVATPGTTPQGSTIPPPVKP